MIRKIEDNLWCFHFEAPREDRLGNNIFALFNDKDVLLIDAGYTHHMDTVLDELKDFNITDVIPTHYHPDHIDGMRRLKDVRIYGNEHAVEPIKLYMPEDVEILSPNTLIRDGESLIFGSFTLKFYHVPGHSDCSMLININDKYLCAGDQYMTTDNGTDVVPYVYWDGLEKHIESLKKVKDMNIDKLLLSHGVPFVEPSTYMKGIDNRIIYMSRILESDNEISIEDALKDIEEPFAFTRWRNDIQKRKG